MTGALDPALESEDCAKAMAFGTESAKSMPDN